MSNHETSGTDRLLSLDDLRDRVNVSAATVRRMLRAGELPAPVQLGRRLLWRESDLASFIRELAVRG